MFKTRHPCSFVSCTPCILQEGSLFVSELELSSTFNTQNDDEIGRAYSRQTKRTNVAIIENIHGTLTITRLEGQL